MYFVKCVCICSGSAGAVTMACECRCRFGASTQQTPATAIFHSSYCSGIVLVVMRFLVHLVCRCWVRAAHVFKCLTCSISISGVHTRHSTAPESTRPTANRSHPTIAMLQLWLRTCAHTKPQQIGNSRLGSVRRAMTVNQPESRCYREAAAAAAEAQICDTNGFY